MEYYPDEIKLLETLKYIQGGPEGYVYVDFDNAAACACEDVSHAAAEKAIQLQTRASALKLKDLHDLDDLLKHACKAGYLKCPAMAPIYHVTFEGRNVRGVVQREKWRALMNGVLFPILVSIFTTLITLAIKGLFSR